MNLRGIIVIKPFCLLCLGLFMVCFPFSEDYWLLLNPKFKWLTFSAGFGLVVLGATALWVVGTKKAWPTLLLIGVLATGLWGINVFSPQTDHTAAAPWKKPETSVIHQFNGERYTPINLAELNFLTEQRPESLDRERFVFQGKASRVQGSGKGDWVVLRTTVFCCLADAVAMGFVLAESDFKGINHGDWVKVYARLIPWSDKEKNIPQIRTRGAFFTSINRNFQVRADKVEKINQPKLPFIFVIHTKPPYTY
ncbi:TIGR03943 family putative permease subunit [Dethiosulfatarculus sandiegensis]|uniref:DUF1980 domain-containing protein n=1 Tax=Dethiosulfatarculus sandiegensis TaxID=1429043 RepID=A0A0D2J6X2_9BACT|nr:hypothetical protein [Dethiosulfatarculus sandiegensis]KIX13924.1 hypothetical protein X474_12195 [Dethiosulfatarculus sandiegensis]